VTKQQAIQVSDKERTLIDRLRLPEYAGGVSEVAKPLWMSKNQIKLTRLLDYANRFHNGALTRRLGFLLELYDVAPSGELARLRTKLTTTYDRLDPTLPKSGPFLSRWRLQLNIDKAELEAIPDTYSAPLPGRHACHREPGSGLSGNTRPMPFSRTYLVWRAICNSSDASFIVPMF
jgi:hypothetical protein